MSGNTGPPVPATLTVCFQHVSQQREKPPRPLDDAKRREICAIVACGGTRTQAARNVGHRPKPVLRRGPCLAFATK